MEADGAYAICSVLFNNIYIYRSLLQDPRASASRMARRTTAAGSISL